MQTEKSKVLPDVDELSAAQSARVHAHISGRIDAAGGSISFAEFMHEAMYAPGLGYYAAGATKFGSAGDFITAPEVSPVFGRVLARQIAEVLQQLTGGEILEFGAGSGRLAVDVLQVLESLGELPVYYNILEVSADLTERQRDAIAAASPHLLHRVRWLPEPPESFNGVIIANEVLDAMPFECFKRADSKVLQRRVAQSEGGLVWSESPASDDLVSAVEEIEADIGHRLADGYSSELSFAARRWTSDLGDLLTEGVAIIFDYGLSRRELYAADRESGWLRCHFRHRAHDNPLHLPGVQDITTWVDFTAVAGAAVEAGLDLLGYQTQAQFLMGGGLEKEMAGFAELSTEEQVRLSGQIKKLTLPGEMGENFKCIALGRGDINSPTAFDFADRTQTL